jgi:hypothetical protein
MFRLLGVRCRGSIAFGASATSLFAVVGEDPVHSCFVTGTASLQHGQHLGMLTVREVHTLHHKLGRGQ